MKIKNPKLDVKIEMNPNNSFYWREAAEQNAKLVDDYTRERATKATKNIRRQVGKGIFLKSTAPSLGTSMTALQLAEGGAELIEALRKFYKSRVIWDTHDLLMKGKYDYAKIYWEKKCVNQQTIHGDCEKFRLVLSEKSSLLSASVYLGWEPAMRRIFEHWRSAAEGKEQRVLAAPTNLVIAD